MSLYRDQRDAALQLVAELEHKVSEQQAQIQERDAELALLRRELGKTAQARTKKDKLQQASWVVAACVALGSIALVAGSGFALSGRCHRAARATGQAAQPNSVPGPFATYARPKAEVDPMSTRTWPNDEAAIRRYLEPKVRAGQGTIPEMKMLMEICAHAGDKDCQLATRAQLDAARTQGR